MSKYDEDLLVSVNHGEEMHKAGLAFGRQNAFNDIISMLLSNDDATGSGASGLDAVRVIMNMRQAEMNEEMISEQYEAEAKADNRTDIL